MATATALKASPLQPDDWIRAAFARLSTEGIESVRIELLARDLGVSKGSFYWHFQDREELLAKMLDRWEGDEIAWLDDTVRHSQSRGALGAFRGTLRGSCVSRVWKLRCARGLAATSAWQRAFPPSRKNAPRTSPASCAILASLPLPPNPGPKSLCSSISAGWTAPRAIWSFRFPAAASANFSRT